ncbi:nuclease [Desulfovibrio sp. AM18-2]|nr:nuclease [Desulfovibrio sp. AM18-2]
MRTEAKGAPAVPCLCPRRAILCDTNPRRLAAWTALLLWACALVLAAPCIAADKPLPKPQATVARCFDGDTLKLTDRRVLRLAGLDAPELYASKGGKPQYYAREARDRLTDLVRGQTVTLLAAGVKHKDPHGRWLAEVLLANGQSLNEILVREGTAFFYPHRDLSPQLQERLHAAQREAIAQKRGLWARLLSLPVAQATYLGNKESLRFFPTDCAAVQHIKPRNRVYFGNLMDAFMAGYAPARVCPFWPLVP